MNQSQKQTMLGCLIVTGVILFTIGLLIVQFAYEIRNIP